MTDRSAKNMINGVFADYLTIHDRAIHYGDGLFETILGSNNILFFWQQHYRRLQTSAEKLKLSCPDEGVLLTDIALLLEKNEISDQTIDDSQAYAIKIILTRGTGERGYRFSKGAHENRVVLLSALETNYSSLLSETLLSGKLYQCLQQATINESLAGLKHLNRLDNVLARNEWDNQYIDGLMLNANKYVIEGTMSNLFAIKDQHIFTPDLSQSGVKGIMRDIIITLAKKNNIQLSVVNVKIDEILQMDELFISNSLIGMKSINKLGDSIYKEQAVSTIIFNDLLTIKDDYAQVV